jgi:antitoxin HicB
MKISNQTSAKQHSFTVIYEPIKEGGYQVTVPALSGLITFGRSLEEAREMVSDAVICYLEGMEKEKNIIPCENSIQERLTIAIA